MSLAVLILPLLWWPERPGAQPAPAATQINRKDEHNASEYISKYILRLIAYILIYILQYCHVAISSSRFIENFE